MASDTTLAGICHEFCERTKPHLRGHCVLCKTELTLPSSNQALAWHAVFAFRYGVKQLFALCLCCWFEKNKVLVSALQKGTKSQHHESAQRAQHRLEAMKRNKGAFVLGRVPSLAETETFLDAWEAMKLPTTRDQARMAFPDRSDPNGWWREDLSFITVAPICIGFADFVDFCLCLNDIQPSFEDASVQDWYQDAADGKLFDFCEQSVQQSATGPEFSTRKDVSVGSKGQNPQQKRKRRNTLETILSKVEASISNWPLELQTATATPLQNTDCSSIRCSSTVKGAHSQISSATSSVEQVASAEEAQSEVPEVLCEAKKNCKQRSDSKPFLGHVPAELYLEKKKHKRISFLHRLVLQANAPVHLSCESECSPETTTWLEPCTGTISSGVDATALLMYLSSVNAGCDVSAKKNRASRARARKRKRETCGGAQKNSTASKADQVCELAKRFDASSVFMLSTNLWSGICLPLFKSYSPACYDRSISGAPRHLSAEFEHPEDCICTRKEYYMAFPFFCVRAKQPYMDSDKHWVASAHQVMSFKPSFSLASSLGWPIRIRDCRLTVEYTDFLMRAGVLEKHAMASNGPALSIDSFNMPLTLKRAVCDLGVPRECMGKLLSCILQRAEDEYLLWTKVQDTFDGRIYDFIKQMQQKQGPLSTDVSAVQCARCDGRCYLGYTEPTATGENHGERLCFACSWSHVAHSRGQDESRTQLKLHRFAKDDQSWKDFFGENGYVVLTGLLDADFRKEANEQIEHILPELSFKEKQEREKTGLILCNANINEVRFDRGVPKWYRQEWKKVMELGYFDMDFIAACKPVAEQLFGSDAILASVVRRSKISSAADRAKEDSTHRLSVHIDRDAMGSSRCGFVLAEQKPLSATEFGVRVRQEPGLRVLSVLDGDDKSACFVFNPGSHQLYKEFRANHECYDLDTQQTNLSKKARPCSSFGRPEAFVECRMKTGDTIFFDDRLQHRNSPGVTSRSALLMSWIPRSHQLVATDAFQHAPSSAVDVKQVKSKGLQYCLGLEEYKVSEGNPEGKTAILPSYDVGFQHVDARTLWSKSSHKDQTVEATRFAKRLRAEGPAPLAYFKCGEHHLTKMHMERLLSGAMNYIVGTFGRRRYEDLQTRGSNLGAYEVADDAVITVDRSLSVAHEALSETTRGQQTQNQGTETKAPRKTVPGEKEDTASEGDNVRNEEKRDALSMDSNDNVPDSPEISPGVLFVESDDEQDVSRTSAHHDRSSEAEKAEGKKMSKWCWRTVPSTTKGKKATKVTKEANLNRIELPTQSNAVDCGVYASLFMCHIAAADDLTSDHAWSKKVVEFFGKEGAETDARLRLTVDISQKRINYTLHLDEAVDQEAQQAARQAWETDEHLCLKPGNCLDDDVLNLYIELLRAWSSQKRGDIMLMSTFFLQCVINTENTKKKHKKNKTQDQWNGPVRWINKSQAQQPHACAHFLIPLNSSNHWSLLWLAGRDGDRSLRNPCVRILDSVVTSPKANVYERSAVKLMRDLFQTVEVVPKFLPTGLRPIMNPSNACPFHALVVAFSATPSLKQWSHDSAGAKTREVLTEMEEVGVGNSRCKSSFKTDFSECFFEVFKALVMRLHQDALPQTSIDSRASDLYLKLVNSGQVSLVKCFNTIFMVKEYTTDNMCSDQVRTDGRFPSPLVYHSHTSRRCDECGYESNVCAALFDVWYTIPPCSGGTLSLDTVLHSHSDVTTCPQCGKNKCKNTAYLATTPEVLMVHLVRGQESESHQLVKKEFSVDFPSDVAHTFDVTNMLVPGCKEKDVVTKYQIQAVIHHTGDAQNSGHYTAVVRHENLLWSFNDSLVNRVGSFDPFLPNSSVDVVFLQQISKPMETPGSINDPKVNDALMQRGKACSSNNAGDGPATLCSDVIDLGSCESDTMEAPVVQRNDLGIGKNECSSNNALPGNANLTRVRRQAMADDEICLSSSDTGEASGTAIVSSKSRGSNLGASDCSLRGGRAAQRGSSKSRGNDEISLSSSDSSEASGTTIVSSKSRGSNLGASDCSLRGGRAFGSGMRGRKIQYFNSLQHRSRREKYRLVKKIGTRKPVGRPRKLNDDTAKQRRRDRDYIRYHNLKEVRQTRAKMSRQEAGWQQAIIDCCGTKEGQKEFKTLADTLMANQVETQVGRSATSAVAEVGRAHRQSMVQLLSAELKSHEVKHFAKSAGVSTKYVSSTRRNPTGAEPAEKKPLLVTQQYPPKSKQRRSKTRVHEVNVNIIKRVFKASTHVRSGARRETRELSMSMREMYSHYYAIYPQMLREAQKEYPQVWDGIAKKEKLTRCEIAMKVAVEQAEAKGFDVDAEYKDRRAHAQEKVDKKLIRKRLSNADYTRHQIKTYLDAFSDDEETVGDLSTQDMRPPQSTQDMRPPAEKSFWKVLRAEKIRWTTRIRHTECPLHDEGPKWVSELETIVKQQIVLDEELKALQQSLNDAVSSEKGQEVQEVARADVALKDKEIADHKKKQREMTAKVRRWHLHEKQYETARKVVQRLRDEKLMAGEALLFRDFVAQYDCDGKKIHNLVLVFQWREKSGGPLHTFKFNNFCTDKETASSDAYYVADVFEYFFKEGGHKFLRENKIHTVYLSGDHGSHFSSIQTMYNESCIWEKHGIRLHLLSLCSYHAYNLCDGAGVESKRIQEQHARDHRGPTSSREMATALNESTYHNSVGIDFEKINRGIHTFPELKKNPGFNLRKKCEVRYDFLDESGEVKREAGIILCRDVPCLPGEEGVPYEVYQLLQNPPNGEICQPCSKERQRPVRHGEEPCTSMARQSKKRKQDMVNEPGPSPGRIQGPQKQKKNAEKEGPKSFMCLVESCKFKETFGSRAAANQHMKDKHGIKDSDPLWHKKPAPENRRTNKQVKPKGKGKGQPPSAKDGTGPGDYSGAAEESGGGERKEPANKKRNTTEANSPHCEAEGKAEPTIAKDGTVEESGGGEVPRTPSTESVMKANLQRLVREMHQDGGADTKKKKKKKDTSSKWGPKDGEYVPPASQSDPEASNLSSCSLPARRSTRKKTIGTSYEDNASTSDQADEEEAECGRSGAHASVDEVKTEPVQNVFVGEYPPNIVLGSFILYVRYDDTTTRHYLVMAKVSQVVKGIIKCSDLQAAENQYSYECVFGPWHYNQSSSTAEIEVSRVVVCFKSADFTKRQQGKQLNKKSAKNVIKKLRENSTTPTRFREKEAVTDWPKVVWLWCADSDVESADESSAVQQYAGQVMEKNTTGWSVSFPQYNDHQRYMFQEGEIFETKLECQEYQQKMCSQFDDDNEDEDHE